MHSQAGIIKLYVSQDLKLQFIFSTDTAEWIYQEGMPNPVEVVYFEVLFASLVKCTHSPKILQEA